MDNRSGRFDIDDTDYDGRNGKRWYYRLSADHLGRWFWEPRLPTPAEQAAPHTLNGVSWEPTVVAESEGPPSDLCGPYLHRGAAITVAEDWFESR